MNRTRTSLVGKAVILAAMAAAGATAQPLTTSSFNSITRTEVEMLIADVAQANPKILKRMTADPAMKQEQLNNLRKLLAFATQAQKEGLADIPANRQELESVRSEVIAVNYDRELNKGKGPAPLYGFITDEQVGAFWASSARQTLEAEFDLYFAAKIALLKASNPKMANTAFTNAERAMAKEFFAKTRIYQVEYEERAKTGAMPEALIAKVALQVKLQQAQFLSRLYSEKLAARSPVGEKGREKETLDRILADNDIQVPDDFTIPAIPASAEKKGSGKRKSAVKNRR